jgi:hypothetical protein
MAKKKAKEEFKFVKISEFNLVYENVEIPEGATHVEAETDYSNCYYESDQPSVKVIFYRKEKNI